MALPVTDIEAVSRHKLVEEIDEVKLGLRLGRNTLLGKRVGDEHSKEIERLGYPVLAAVSRKSFIGKILGGVPPEERLAGSLAATKIAVLNGATIIRTHDVKATKQAIRDVQRRRG
jgi:dihydropteroate synthase